MASRSVKNGIIREQPIKRLYECTLGNLIPSNYPDFFSSIGLPSTLNKWPSKSVKKRFSETLLAIIPLNLMLRNNSFEFNPNGELTFIILVYGDIVLESAS